MGSDQVRGVCFEGERMILVPPPRRTGEEHRKIMWERIAASLQVRKRLGGYGTYRVTPSTAPCSRPRSSIAM